MVEDGLYTKKKQNKQHPIVEDNCTSEQDIYINQYNFIYLIQTTNVTPFI